MTPDQKPTETEQLLATQGSTTARGTEDELRERCRMLGLTWHERQAAADSDATVLIEADVAVRLRVVPLRLEGSRLILAMLDPLDTDAADEIATLTGKPVTREGMEKKHFSELMREHYGTTASKMADALAGSSDDMDDDLEHNLEAIEADDIHRMAEEPTLINLVNLILLEAIQSRASDVHIEPFENELTVRYRIDGLLHTQKPPPKHLQPALIGRIKIMSGMNIAERYVPQDGKIALRFEGRKVDIRVSTIPTLYGESVVMRILDKTALSLDLKTLGMRQELIKTMDGLIQKPHGMVLVTGPTGSGKTTTLYAALTRLYDPSKKIITIEDPVEYELGGINQIPVNPKRGLTFASGLRSILRQDPDVIFVGEVRDGETADIAIRSALTGHLIFSTVHTNDAVSSVGRLVDMGAEPFLVASVLEGLLAQRLGRRTCPHCREQVAMTDEQGKRLRRDELEMFNGLVWHGVGCEKCNNTGYLGRIGYFELLKINGTVRAAISSGASSNEIRDVAKNEFVTMRQDGLLRAMEGETTIAEVLRATQDADDMEG